MALVSVVAYSQTLTLSTYQGTDITKYDGLSKNVSVSRYVFNGWNTISLPFSVSAEQVAEVFGSDCRLEKLAGVESDGMNITLNFVDCKAEGIVANVPYILHYTGASETKNITVQNALLKKSSAKVSFSDVNGTVVTFAAALTKRDAKGAYGIMAKDNGEANFVNVNNVSTGFYATRCYVELSNGTSTTLKTNHIGAGEATSINAVLRGNEKADVYSLSGAKVDSSLNASSVSKLPAGVYVVNNKKVAVK